MPVVEEDETMAPGTFTISPRHRYHARRRRWGYVIYSIVRPRELLPEGAAKHEKCLFTGGRRRHGGRRRENASFLQRL